MVSRRHPRRSGCFWHGPRYWSLCGGQHGARPDPECRCTQCMSRPRLAAREVN